MTEIPSEPDSSEEELYPEVVLPDKQSASADDSAGPTVDASDSTGQEHPSLAAKGSERTPIKFKKASEAIPLDPQSSESRRRRHWHMSDYGRQKTHDLFTDERTIRDSRNSFAKPVLVIIGLLWFLGIVYLFKLSWDKQNGAKPVADRSTVAATADTEDQEPSSLGEAYRQLQDQLQKADELFEHSHHRDSLERAAELKLSALVDWNVLDLSSNRDDVKMNNELVRATRRYIGHNNASIDTHAQQGLMLLQIREYLGSPETGFWPEISNRFEELLTLEREDPTNSRNFLMIANAIAERGLNNESRDLYRLIHQKFSNNGNFSLASIARLANDKLQELQNNDSEVAVSTTANETGLADAPASADSIAVSSDEAEDDVAAVGFDEAAAPDPDAAAIASQIPETARASQTSRKSDPASTVNLPASTSLADHEDPFGQQLPDEPDENSLVVQGEMPVDNLPDQATAFEDVASGGNAVDVGQAAPQTAMSEDQTEDQESDLLRQPEAATNTSPDGGTTHADQAVTNWQPPNIEPAPEPESLQPAPRQSAHHPIAGSVDVDREIVGEATTRNTPAEPESAIQSVLAERDGVDPGQPDPVQPDGFDDVMQVDSALKIETQLEPRVEPDASVALAQALEAVEDDVTFRDPTEVAPDSPGSQTDLVEPHSPLSQIANEKLAEFRQRIRAEIEAQNVSTATLNSSIEFADYLIEMNSISSAKQLLDEIGNAVYMIADGSERSQLRERFYSSRKRSDYFGQTFNYVGLFDVDGNPIRLDPENSELKLIVFWSLSSPICHQLIEQIERLENEFNSRRVKVIAVCQVADSDTQNDLRRVAADNPSIEFYQVQANDRSSKRFNERFPVRKYPYLLMLSADDRVVGINRDPVFFDPVGR